MIARFFGLDVHKNYVVACGVNEQQDVVFPAERVTMVDFKDWVKRTLKETDEVALEVSSNAWVVADILREQVGRVAVVNPYKTKLIAQARIKNDRVDAQALAQLLAARFLAEVWLPERPVREQRALAAHRARLQKQTTQVRNRVHAILRRQNLLAPVENLFTQVGQTWLEQLSLPPTERLELEQLLEQLALLKQQLDRTDRLLASEALHDPRIPYLLQLTGIGVYSAFALLAYIGPIERFETPQQLTSYAGLTPGEHQSGDRAFSGPITRQGHPILRWLMVEAAHSAIRFDPPLVSGP